ncbi:MAG: radical SAM protein [Nitrospiraceae bacterium]|nr:radical SAM protein [Nitrospiraceae bacterium]
MNNLPFLDIDIPVTFKDQPGIMSAVLYTRINLCNLNCYQCHNRLLYQEEKPLITKKNLSEKLDKLRNLGVKLIVISGGEPTIMPNFEDGLKFLKNNSFDVRLDSNGTSPDKIKSLISNKLIAD